MSETSKKDRRRKQNPKRHQLCLRLNDKQWDLLRAYRKLKSQMEDGYDTEVDALRQIIDGLEGWLARQVKKRDRELDRASAQDRHPKHHRSEHQSEPAEEAHSGLEDEDEPITSVGDFAGRPHIGLPEPHWDDGD